MAEILFMLELTEDIKAWRAKIQTTPTRRGKASGGVARCVSSAATEDLLISGLCLLLLLVGRVVISSRPLGGLAGHKSVVAKSP